MRDSLIWYLSFYESIKDLDANTFKECASALMEYAFYDNIPSDLSPMAQMFFTSNKPQVDANIKRRTDGSKGGRPKKPMVINTETSGFESKNHRLSNQKPNVNVNANVNVNDNANDNDNAESLINSVTMNKYYPIGRKKTKEDVLNEYDRMRGVING